MGFVMNEFKDQREMELIKGGKKNPSDRKREKDPKKKKKKTENCFNRTTSRAGESLSQFVGGGARSSAENVQRGSRPRRAETKKSERMEENHRGCLGSIRKEQARCKKSVVYPWGAGAQSAWFTNLLKIW